MRKITIDQTLTKKETGITEPKVVRYLQLLGFVPSEMEPTEEEYCEAVLKTKYQPCMYLEFNRTEKEKVIIRINDVEGYVEKINAYENYYVTNYIEGEENLKLSNLDDKLNLLTSNYRY